MILTGECLYKLDQKLNSLSTSVNHDIPLEDKLLALNEAQIECVLSKIDINNIYRLGFDGFRKRYEDLEILIQPHEKLNLLIADKNLNKYSSSLEDLKSKYLLYANIYALADKGSCKDRVLYVNIKKHSDIHIYLNNSNYCPSFEYQETLGTITKGSLEIYSDGTFTPKEAHLSYLTYPQEFDMEGYIKLDGEDSKSSNSNLPEYMANEIIAIATRNLAGPTANQEALITSQAALQKND